MNYNIPEELINDAEMIYGKYAVRSTLAKPTVQALYRKSAKEALTVYFNPTEDSKLSDKDLTILCIVGDLDYTDKRFSKDMIRLIANPYVRKWLFDKNRKPFKEGYPHSNSNIEDVELAVNYIESLDLFNNTVRNNTNKRCMNEQGRRNSKGF